MEFLKRRQTIRQNLRGQKYSIFLVIEYVNTSDNTIKTARLDIMIDGRNINNDEFMKRQAQTQFLRNGIGLGDYGVAVINNIDIIEKIELIMKN